MIPNHVLGHRPPEEAGRAGQGRPRYTFGVNRLEITDFDKNCLLLLEASPKKHSRHCFRSAINHFEKAEKLIQTDQEMAAFRCITAEEEAASGLMQVLRERRYENADKLRPRDHIHKNAIFPFLVVLGSFFHEVIGVHGVIPKLHIKEENGKRLLTIGVPMVIEGEELLVYPVPPLNFMIKSDERRISYRKQITAFVEAQGARDISTHVREQANLRNQILYASPSGYPGVSNLKTEFFTIRQKRIFALLKAYLFIYPYSERQPFVQDVLDAFLAMIGALDTHDLHEEV